MSLPPVSPYARLAQNWHWDVSAKTIVYALDDHDYHYLDPHKRHLKVNDTSNLVPAGRLIPQASIDRLPRALRAQYDEDHRFYHASWHLRHMLAVADDMEMGLTPALLNSIFYHDYVYIPAYTDNEAASARMAFLHLADTDYTALSSIRENILATARHDAPLVAFSHEVSTFLDLDLVALGLPFPAYRIVDHLIWLEYRSVCQERKPSQPRRAFREGQRAVLKKILSKGCVFRTPLFRERYEAQAIANLKQQYNL